MSNYQENKLNQRIEGLRLEIEDQRAWGHHKVANLLAEEYQNLLLIAKQYD
jgi:hypothetical protein